MIIVAGVLTLMLLGARPNVACGAMDVSRTTFDRWRRKAADRLPGYLIHPTPYWSKTKARKEPPFSETYALASKLKNLP